MAMVSVRYIVDDVDATIAFYTERLGFGIEFRRGRGYFLSPGARPRFRGPLAWRPTSLAERARHRRSRPTHA